MRTASALLGIVALVAALAVVAGAQDGKDKGTGKAKGQLPAGWKALNLTATQKAKVYEVQGAYKGKIEELEKKLAALRDERHAALLKLLTSDQKAKLSGTEPPAKDAPRDKATKDEKK